MRDQSADRYKTQAYKERDSLIIVLSKVWPSHLMRHPESDTEWAKGHSHTLIVCVHSPAGRCAWHIPDVDAPKFAHLKMKDHEWIKADGAERYERLLAWEPSTAPASAAFGSLGGKARAAKLTDARKREIARSAALTRWAGHTKKTKQSA